MTPFLDQSKHNGCHYYFRFCDGNKGCLNKPAIDNVSDDTLFSKNKSLCKFLCHLRTNQKKSMNSAPWVDYEKKPTNLKKKSSHWKARARFLMLFGPSLPFLFLGGWGKDYTLHVDNNRRVTLIFKKTNDTDTWLNPLCVGEIEVALTKKRRGVSAFFLRFFFEWK